MVHEAQNDAAAGMTDDDLPRIDVRSLVVHDPHAGRGTFAKLVVKIDIELEDDDEPPRTADPDELAGELADVVKVARDMMG